MVGLSVGRSVGSSAALEVVSDSQPGCIVLGCLGCGLEAEQTPQWSRPFPPLTSGVIGPCSCQCLPTFPRYAAEIATTVPDLRPQQEVSALSRPPHPVQASTAPTVCLSIIDPSKSVTDYPAGYRHSPHTNRIPSRCPWKRALESLLRGTNELGSQGCWVGHCGDHLESRDIDVCRVKTTQKRGVPLGVLPFHCHRQTRRPVPGQPASASEVDLQVYLRLTGLRKDRTALHCTALRLDCRSR